MGAAWPLRLYVTFMCLCDCKSSVGHGLIIAFNSCAMNSRTAIEEIAEISRILRHSCGMKTLRYSRWDGKSTRDSSWNEDAVTAHPAAKKSFDSFFQVLFPWQREVEHQQAWRSGISNAYSSRPILADKAEYVETSVNLRVSLWSAPTCNTYYELAWSRECI